MLEYKYLIINNFDILPGLIPLMGKIYNIA